MTSLLTTAYVLAALAQTLIFLWAYSRSRSYWHLGASLLSLLVLVLLLTPESTLVSWIVALPLGQNGALYVSSALVRSSRSGIVTYGVLVLLPLAVGRVWKGFARPHRANPKRARRH